MPIDPNFLTPGGGLRSPLVARALGRLDAPGDSLVWGTRVGPYRIQHELGRGGMAVVYLGERADGEFEQSVALKLVRPDGDSEFAQALLRKERQILAGLQHPCIARLLDGGRTADGVLWFALELVHGTRIDRYCRELRLPPARRLALFAQLCDAVQFAHSRLLIHRDIKPANILVTRDESVKLLDFGIAQLLAPGADDALAQRALTPGYASPEQLRGEPVTTASDIYQLGRLLQSMFGPDRFEGGPDAAPGDTATESTTLHPLEPGANPGGETAHIPTELAAIIGKAMRPVPADRYATVAELRSDVGNFTARRPVSAREGGAIYRVACLVRRQRWALAATFVAIVIFAATVLHFTLRVASERDQARQAAMRAEAEAGRAAQVTEFLVGMFQVADPDINRGDKLTATQILDRGAVQVEQALSDQAALQANLLLVIGEVYQNLGDYPRAEPLLAHALELRRADSAATPAELAHALRQLAQVRHKRAQYAQAKELLAEAEATLRERGDPDHELASILDLRGLAQKHLGDLDGALSSHQAAIAAARDSADAKSLAAAENHLGLLLYNMDRLEAAQLAYEEALAIDRRLFGEKNTRVSSTEENLAMVLSARGDNAAAEQMMRSAIATEKELLGADNVEYAQSLNMYGNMLADENRFENALSIYQEALAVAQRSGAGEGDEAASILSNLGSVYGKLQRHEQARVCLERAIVMRSKLSGPDYFEIAHTEGSLAETLVSLGRAREAEALARAAVGKLRKALPANHTFIADVEGQLAIALIALHRSDEARPLLEEAVRILQGNGERAQANELLQLLAKMPARRGAAG